MQFILVAILALWKMLCASLTLAASLSSLPVSHVTL